VDYIPKRVDYHSLHLGAASELFNLFILVKQP